MTCNEAWLDIASVRPCRASTHAAIPQHKMVSVKILPLTLKAKFGLPSVLIPESPGCPIFCLAIIMPSIIPSPEYLRKASGYVADVAQTTILFPIANSYVQFFGGAAQDDEEDGFRLRSFCSQEKHGIPFRETPGAFFRARTDSH
jgi:hypothetical protein